MKPRLSFEFFPPKSAEMEQKLWHSVQQLSSLKPAFVSVTYGAGGTTRERTHQTVKRILQETSLAPAAHLTCIGASQEEINVIAQNYWDIGVRHIVALRGDPPEGVKGYTPHPEGYAYASDLVRGLKSIGDFEISVAAFPEMHPESRSFDEDIENLKRKIDQGATRAITQYSFDTEKYLRFVEKARTSGITIPIVPGILPISNFAQLIKFSAMCGASVPDWLKSLFEGLDENPTLRDQRSIEVTTRQCEMLRKAGVQDFHFYTLNRADLTIAVCQALGVAA